MTIHNAKIGRRYPVMAAAGRGTSKEEKAIIAQIVGQFTNRARQGIKEWRSAIEAADNYKTPNWALLQDMYEYLRPDGHYGSQKDIRKGAVLSTRYYIKDKTGKENPEKSKELEKEWFFELLGDLSDYIFLGYSVIQMTDYTTGSYDVIPRRNFVPQKNMIMLEVGGEKGILITDPAISDSMIVMKNQDKFGILNDIVPDLIWKKNARQAWNEFSDKFGQPMVTATTNKSDKKELDRIEEMLRQLGEAARAVLPMGTTIDIKDTATKGDPYNIFLRQMEYNDAQISKRILGGTMVSDNGSSRSQSEVHERTMDLVIGEMDKKKLEFAINNQLLPKLPWYAEGDEFVFDRSENLNLSEHWKIIAEAMNQGINIPLDWVSETFGFPIDGKTEAQGKGGQLPSARFSGRGKGFFGDART